MRGVVQQIVHEICTQDRAVERNIPSEIPAPWGQISQTEVLGCCERDVLDAFEESCRVFGEHQISIHQVEPGIDVKQWPGSVEACARIERFGLHDEVRNRNPQKIDVRRYAGSVQSVESFDESVAVGDQLFGFGLIAADEHVEIDARQLLRVKVDEPSVDSKEIGVD